MPDFSGLLGEGGEVGKQLLVYGVGYEIARALLGPMFTQIEYLINSGHPVVELSPPELADLVVRGFIANEGDAAERARKFGLDPANFQLMVDAAGEPPGLETVLQWWRRGFIPTSSDPTAPSLETAVRTSRLYNYWLDTIIKGQLAPPSPAALVEAAVRNQIPYQDAVTLAFHGGLGSPQPSVPAGAPIDQTEYAFKILYDTAGRPPAPGQLGELVHRGVIPVHGTGPDALTFEQGVMEGDIKDKWEKPLEALLTVIPSLYEIRILQEHGAVTDQQAAAWLADLGYTADVAGAVAQYATAQAIVTDRQLTESTVVQLYRERFIDDTEATTLLTDLGYPAEAAGFILAAADLQVVLGALTSAISRVGNYFIAHKVTQDQAAQALRDLGLADAQVQTLLQTWATEQSLNVKLLTESQIADAWEYGIMDQPTAISELQALGYTPFDAWVVLSVKNKAPLPGQPPPGPPGIA